MPMQV